MSTAPTTTDRSGSGEDEGNGDDGRGRRQLGRQDAIDAGFLTVLTLVGLVGFRTSYGGTAWLLAGTLGLGLGLVIGYTVAMLRQTVAVAVLATVVGAVLVAPLVLPDTALAGVLPTGRTVTALVDGGLQGWISLLSVVPPVGSTYHLLAVPFLAGLVVTVTSVTVATRLDWAWPPVVAPAVLLVLTILFGTLDPAAPLVQGAVFAGAALAWVAQRSDARAPAWHPGRRGRRVLVAVPVLVLVTVCGGFLGPRLPGADDHERYVLRDTATPPFDPHAYPSPLGRFREYVTAEKDKDLLAVEGMAPGERLRLASMDAYDGLVWSVAGGVGPSAGSSGWFEKTGARIPLPQNLPAGGRPVTVSVGVGNFEGVWLPDAGDVTRISFDGPRAATLTDSFRYNRLTGTGALPVRLRQGDSYTFQALVPQRVTIDKLVGRALEQPSQPKAANIASQLTEFVTQVVDDAGDGVQRTITLQKALREGYYSDGGEAEAPSLAGHGARRMTELFDEANLVGDDEQYAAAMALALRVLGVPSRVVMGFEVNAKHPTVIKGSDAVAWVEVPVEGAGWVAVDPTPDENRKLTDQKPRPRPRPRTQNQPQPPPPVVAPDQEVQATQAQPRRDSKESESSSLLQVLTVAAWFALPLLLAGAAAGTVLGLKARRRRRRMSAPRPTERIAGGWLEVTDLARDLGTPVTPRATRREGARELHEAAPTSGVVALAERADAGVFGPGEPSDDEVTEFWRDVDRTRAGLLSGVSRWGRLRARLALRSLRRR